jgi:hypothetical protein
LVLALKLKIVFIAKWRMFVTVIRLCGYTINSEFQMIPGRAARYVHN